MNERLNNYTRDVDVYHVRFERRFLPSRLTTKKGSLKRLRCPMVGAGAVLHLDEAANPEHRAFFRFPFRVIEGVKLENDSCGL